MKPLCRASKTLRRGFTVIELMVALVVTGILASMLLKISNDVLNTYNQTTGELESHLAARFVLDQLAEDLQAAVTRRDGNVWLAATIRDKKSTRDLTDQWEDAASIDKPIAESLLLDELLENCRYGVGGVWLRLITQSPDALSGKPGARAVSYLIDRRAVGTPDGSEGESSSLATRRYTLFRGDVSPRNSFETGFNLHPQDGNYSNAGPSNETRDRGQVNSPALDNGLIDNVIDFGVRFYVKDPDTDGDGYSDSFEERYGADPYASDDSPSPPFELTPLNGLRLIFPADSTGALSMDDTDHLATGLPPAEGEEGDSSSSGEQVYFSTRYPDVADVMVRVLTVEGAEAIRAFEEGDSPRSSEYSSDAEYWWHLAEQHSYVFVRRIQLYPSGI